MHILDIDKIKIGENRQRRVFDDDKISELAESIRSSKGLLNPITVRPDGDEYLLVAGERRLRAIKTLQLLDETFTCNGEAILPGKVPALLLSELTELEYEEAELEENVVRVDLTLQEQALAIARLHELRVKQNGKQTLTETGREVYGDGNLVSNVNRISHHLAIARHMDDPEVQKAKTMKEALKVIEKKTAARHREELAKTFDTSKTSHKLIHGDSFQEVPKLPDNTFALVLTDPPYGVNAEEFGSQADTAHNYRDDKDYAFDCYRLTAREGFRVTKSNGAIFAFCDVRHFPALVQIFAEEGWTVWERPLIWSKKNGMLPLPDRGPRVTYEAILYAYKPDTRVCKAGQPDVLTYVREGNTLHAAQKPPALFLDLMARHALPGDHVVDFFCGSGPIFVAANTLQCYATGIESSEYNYHIALARLAKSVADEELDETLSLKEE